MQVQVACADEVPDAARIKTWVAAALKKVNRDGEVSVRVVGEDEMAALNKKYRGKTGATNVLAFAVGGVAAPVDDLGDVVVCAPVVAAEAAAARRPFADHFARMVVHGVLHLCGCDHDTDADAAAMVALEREIVVGLGLTFAP